MWLMLKQIIFGVHPLAIPSARVNSRDVKGQMPAAFF
jgi:hypothetical protein